MPKKPVLVTVALVIAVGTVVTVLALADRDGARGGGAGGGDEATSGGAGSSTADSSVSTLKGSPDATARQASAAAPLARRVVSTGQVTLQTDDLAHARAEVVRLITAWGGVVADEQSTSDDHGRLSDSTLVLRVPSDHFDEAMNAFGTLGEVEQRSQKSQDVTTKVIDNDARVRAAERSIQQIESLLSRAGRLADVIAIEDDLARRQADLDSLKSQQAWLEDQTSLSTITAYLGRSPVHHATREAKGFLAGLENGWHALGGTTVAALTVTGALLPFLVLLALLGAPLWWVRRRGARLSAGNAPARSA